MSIPASPTHTITPPIPPTVRLDLPLAEAIALDAQLADFLGSFHPGDHPLIEATHRRLLESLSC